MFTGLNTALSEYRSSGCWWNATAKNFAGTTLKGVTENTPASRYVKAVLAPAFEAETGIIVDLELTSWEDMYDKGIRDMSRATGIYDFVFIEQDIIYAYLAQDYLVNFSELHRNQEILQAPAFKFEDFTSYIDFFRSPESNDVFAVPMESFLRVYAYRRDLFEDPQIQRAFFKQYNYQLMPATTIKQFNDVSVFFTRWGQEKKIPLWGTTIQASAVHPASFYELFETVFPSFGINNWGINLTTKKASYKSGGFLNSPSAVEALQFWIDLLKIAPPESFGSTWTESALTFLSGRVAHGWVYGEYIVPMTTNSQRSNVTGKIATRLPPLAPGILEDAKGGSGYIGYYDGGAFGIPHSSNNKKAALLWLQYIGQPSVQTEWTLATGRVVHKATLEIPAVVEMDRRIGNYFSLVREHDHLFAGAPPLAEHAAIREIIAPFIYQVIRGELLPREALNLAAAAVDSRLVSPQ